MNKLLNSLDASTNEFMNQVATKEKNTYTDLEFSYSKPEKFIQLIVQSASEEGDIVMDFHLGSGTTAAVAHKLNRQYIGIEQIDYIETIAKQRLLGEIEGKVIGYTVSPIALQEGDNAAKNRLTISSQFTIFIAEPEKSVMKLTSTRFVDYDSNTDLTSIESQLLEEIDQQIVQDSLLVRETFGKSENLFWHIYYWNIDFFLQIIKPIMSCVARYNYKFTFIFFK